MMGEMLAMTLKKHCRWVGFFSLSADFFLAQQELFLLKKKQSMRQMIPWHFFLKDCKM
jgi:hypothetical protein